MFNSVALDVVIGLVFIYLLYSLLITVISELISTALSLRARNLKEAIDRMLNDEKPMKWHHRLVDMVRLFKKVDNPVVNIFYDHPEIKYFGSSGLYKTPSFFKAENFSKTLLNILIGDSKVTAAAINTKMKQLAIDKKNLDKHNDKAEALFSRKKKNKNKSFVPADGKIHEETAAYIQGLWNQASGNVEEFKRLLEKWFESTMEHTIEWYKRKLRLLTFLLGFLVAWLFNADTFVFVRNLSTDKAAREQMVSMATAYIESNQYSIDTAGISDAKMNQDLQNRIDSLLVVKQQLEADITKANTILGTGCRLPEVFIIKRDTNISQDNKDTTILFSSLPVVDAKFLAEKYATSDESKIETECRDQWAYFFWLFWHHFFGFLVTSIAISLGAPFWFDLLSKVMSLKTGKKAESNGASGSVAPQPVVVKIENKPGEESAG
jgi:hypothetical protein